MKREHKVVVAYALEQIRAAVAMLEKAECNSKALNLILIGIAGIKKEYREGGK